MGKKIEINLVDHLNIGVIKELFTKELEMAKDTGKGTYEELERARQHLERARGMYVTLTTLELVPVEFVETAGEDLIRIEDKLNDIQRELEVGAFARHLKRRCL